MRVRLLLLVAVITVVAVHAMASHHDVTLTVVSSVTEDVTRADGSSWSSQTTITSVTAGDTCPEHSNPTGDFKRNGEPLSMEQPFVRHGEGQGHHGACVFDHSDRRSF